MRSWINKFQGFSSFELRIIALITMIIDHIGKVIFPHVVLFKMIGRISFPLFCFLLVEGFFYTGSRQKYMLRMLAMAFISEIPYDLAFHGRIIYLGAQNVFFTLSLGLFVMIMMEKNKDTYSRCIVGVIGITMSIFLRTDYSYIGMLMICFFYFFRESKIIRDLGQIAINISVRGIQWVGALALIPIHFYNNKCGNKKYKWLFYSIYPVHLLILYLYRISH